MHASACRRVSRAARPFALLALCAGFLLTRPETASASERRGYQDDFSQRTALPLDRPLFPANGRSIAAFPPIAANAAARAVDAYVAELAASGERPEWRGTSLRQTATFRTSAGTALVYEFTIERDGAAVGAVYAGATTGTTAITGYIPEGRPLSEGLLSHLGAALAVPIDHARVTFYYSGNEQYGAAYLLDSMEPLPMTAEVLVVPETHTVYYAPDFVATTADEWTDHFTPRMRVTDAWAAEQQAVRTELGARTAAPNEPRSLALTATVSREVPGGRGSFPSFYQESRKWPNGTCSSGCTPVAAAALFEYWDRNGFPKLIGTDSGNRKHTYPYEADVIKALEEIRSALGTYCLGDKAGTGATLSSNMPTGMTKYAASKGYKSFTADNVVYFRWINLIDEINAGRPAMLSFTQNGGKVGHTVTVYGYTDASGTSNDTICTMWGWDSQITKCFNVYSSTDDWSYLTRVRK
ncbi:MAG: C39 family peptidase [Acidobacteriota bacterium]